MPLVFNDGSIPFGSQVVLINSVEFVAEEIDFEEKSTAIYRRNEINVPNGGVYIQDLIKGKMTLQLASNDTPIPENQSLVTMDFRGTPRQFVITNVSQPMKQDQIHKMKMVTEVAAPCLRLKIRDRSQESDHRSAER
jgi:hypothetical protein